MFETGQILVGVGVGLLGLLRIIRCGDLLYNGKDAIWSKTPLDLVYRILEFVFLTLAAVGLILALNTYRSWAHEDDIIAIISVTFMLAWATTPGIGESSWTNLKGGDQVAHFILSLLTFVCCLGAYVMLGFIGARGKTSGDRSMVWSGVSLIGTFGPLPIFVHNNMWDKASPTVRGLLCLLECGGWALFFTGALHHELDLETPVGFPVH